MDLYNFICESQMPDFETNQDEFDQLLRNINEEEFTKQLSKLDEPTQPFQNTTTTTTTNEVEACVPKKRKRQDGPRQRPTKRVLVEASSQTVSPQKATLKNVNNNCIDICKPTFTSLPKTDEMDTKGLLKIGKVCLNGEGKKVRSFEVNFKNEGDVNKLKYLFHQWFDEEVKADDIVLEGPQTLTQNENISCDIEWIREDKLLRELLGIVYKYKGIDGFGRINHLKKSLFAFVKFSDNKWNVYKCTNILNLK